MKEGEVIKWKKRGIPCKPLPTPFSLSARIFTPNKSLCPPHCLAATASRGATYAGGTTPIVASRLDWTINYPRFLFMI